MSLHSLDLFEKSSDAPAKLRASQSSEIPSDSQGWCSVETGVWIIRLARSRHKEGSSSGPGHRDRDPVTGGKGALLERGVGPTRAHLGTCEGNEEAGRC